MNRYLLFPRTEDAIPLLKQTLQEEGRANELPTQVAKSSVNQTAKAPTSQASLK